MEIEIITTKTKLTKFILNQMFSRENKEILNHYNVLGYIVNIVKNKFKAVIIEQKGEYYILATNWKKGEKSISRKTGQFSHKVEYFHQYIKFTTATECDDFWKLLQNTLSKATEHIYI